MPVQDGLVTLAELKKRRETMDIPVIMLSASIGDQQAALDAGATYFLRKPYRGELLVQAVNSVIAAQHPRTATNGSERNANPTGAASLTAAADIAARRSNQLNRGCGQIRNRTPNLFEVNSSSVEGLLMGQGVGH
jgi:DNA-binding response OmpR family regulator